MNIEQTAGAFLDLISSHLEASGRRPAAQADGVSSFTAAIMGIDLPLPPRIQPSHAGVIADVLAKSVHRLTPGGDIPERGKVLGEVMGETYHLKMQIDKNNDCVAIDVVAV